MTSYPTGAPVPLNPEAQFAAWRRQIEERIIRLERNRSALEVPATVTGSQLTSQFVLSSIDSTSFGPVWGLHAPRPYFDAMEVVLVVFPPSGGTGQIRLFNSIDGVASTAYSFSTSQRLRFRWLHQADTVLATASRFTAEIQMRRVSGSGAVSALHPEGGYFSPSTYLIDATTEATPTVL